MKRVKRAIHCREKYCMVLCLCLVTLFFFLMIFKEIDILSKVANYMPYKNLSIFGKEIPVVVVDSSVHLTVTDKACTYWNCINSYKCIDDGEGKIGVYIYDIVRYVDEDLKDMLTPMSAEFAQFLWTIKQSKYAVSQLDKACILIPSVDLMNRATFSGEKAARVLASLPYWNNGTNHLIFNVIPGVEPEFLSTLDFHLGNSMITGSGFTQRSYRRTFDISIPFYNPHKQHLNFETHKPSSRDIFLIVSQRQYYSNVYNQLTNHESFTSRSDVVVLTSCSLPLPLGEMNRCDTRGQHYSYPAVLLDAKFCLITRERQFATVHLHNILRAGCVPVVSLDTYIMPFQDVLDWRRAAVFVNENNLDKVVDILSSILSDGNTYSQLVDQGNFYYKNYFQDISRIALVTLEILNERALPHTAKSYSHWNRPIIPSQPPSPFFVPLVPSQKSGFTAVILTYNRFEVMKQVLVNVAKASNVAKIIVIWNNPETNPPGDGHWPEVSVLVQVIHSKYNRLSNRFYPYDEIETDCILSIDDDITMVTPAELDFGYRVWVENADRLVGFPPRYHSVNNFELKYVSEWISNISMVLTGVSFYHKYYHFLFTSALPDGIKDWIDGHMNCEDIAMNFLIANSTGKAPIKVLARKKFKSSATGLSSDMSSHLVARDICLRHFNEAFGQTILHSVEFRADPVLFKEQDLIDDMNLYYLDGAL